MVNVEMASPVPAHHSATAAVPALGAVQTHPTVCLVAANQPSECVKPVQRFQPQVRTELAVTALRVRDLNSATAAQKADIVVLQHHIAHLRQAVRRYLGCADCQ
jgi:hypothetical protein